MSWGVCCTVKAPSDQVLAFVAHHLDLGAAHVWLFLDDPEDEAADLLAARPEVTVTHCSLEWWRGTLGRRPPKHQNRQTCNMNRVYAETSLPWLAHLDVDEFLLPAVPLPEVLASTPSDQPILRAPPWEALHDPDLTDDIFTARQFRAAMPGPGHAGNRSIAFGPHAPLLPDGVLSHSAGKCLFRTGLSRFQPRLHGAFRAGERVSGVPFDERLALLHFHAEDRARWLRQLPFRLSRGAYQFNPALQAALQAAGPEEILAFYDRIQNPDAATRAALSARGLLRSATLDLRAKVSRL
ncbi:glycosyltransferase family 2 protein [Rhodobacter sp. CZR27]|uniref:glycosyltransferase family 2 protein n=1 Tax=Rhodobacter sp. CZR27 TaxID=2033869 RepID=UPI0012FDA4E9|nr:glycosyltransferase family 2 protein [Rhodobacter sp. CZR27]